MGNGKGLVLVWLMCLYCLTLPFLCVSLIAERIGEILGIEMLSFHSSLL